MLYRRESYIHESRLLEPADWHRHPEESVEHLPTLGFLRSYPFASRVFKVSWVNKTEALKGVRGIVTSFGWGRSHRQNLDPPLFARNSLQYVRHSRLRSDWACKITPSMAADTDIKRTMVETRSAQCSFGVEEHGLEKRFATKFQSSWLHGRVRGSCLVFFYMFEVVKINKTNFLVRWFWRLPSL
jgi:hypothetical protein